MAFRGRLRWRAGAVIATALLVLSGLSCGGESGSEPEATTASDDDLRGLVADYFGLLVAGDPAVCELVTPRARRAAAATGRAYSRGEVDVDAGGGPDLELDTSTYRGVQTCGEAVAVSAELLADDQALVDFEEAFADATIELDGDTATVVRTKGDPINRQVVPLQRVDGNWRVDQLALSPPPFAGQ